MTLIDAKFDADLINISEVTSVTNVKQCSRFFWPTLYAIASIGYRCKFVSIQLYSLAHLAIGPRSGIPIATPPRTWTPEGGFWG